MSLGSLVLKLAADIADFQSDLGRAERIAKNQAAAIQKAFSDVGKRIAVGLTSALAGIGFASIVKGSIDAADKLQDLTNRIGGNVKSFSELKFAAEQSGSSFETLSRGLTTISKNAAAAAGGNEAVAKAFEAIGVSVSDSSGQLKSADALFKDIAERFSQFRDGPEKSALALKLFGKAGVELIPVLNEGSAGLAKFAAEAERLGVSIDEGTAQSAAEFNDTMDQVKSALQGVGTEIAKTFLPALKSGAESLREFLVSARESGAVEAFGKAIDFAGQALKILAVYAAGAIAGGALGGIVGAFTAGTTAATAFATATNLANAAVARLGGPIGILAGGLALLVAEITSTSSAMREAEQQMIASAKAAEDAAARLETVRNRAKDQGETVTFGNQRFFEDERKSLEGIQREAARLQETLNGGRKAGVSAKYYETLREDLKLLEAQFVRMGGTSTAFKAALESAGTGAKKLSDDTKPAAPILRDTADASKEAADAAALLAEQQRKAADDARNLLEALKRQAEEENRILRIEADIAEQKRQQSANLNRVLQEQDRELQILQASGQARADLVQLFNAQEQAARTLGASWSELTEEQRRNLGIAVENIRLGEQQIDLARQQAEAVAEAQRYWEQVGGAAADALGEFATEALTNFDNVGDAFDNLADSLGNIAKRTIAQIISEFARLKLINPLLNSILGTSLQTGGSGFLSALFGGSGAAGAAGAQGGGLLGSLGSLFGGGGGAQGGGLLSSIGRIFGFGGGTATGIAGNVGAGLPFGLGNVANAGLGLAQGGGGIGLGGLLGAAGGAFGVYSAFRSGSPVSGALSGALAGSSILPGVGTIIGGIVGALAGIFGGSKTPDLRIGGVGVTRKPEGTFTTELGTFQFGARGIEGKEKEFVKLVTEFDKNIAGIVGSFTNGSEQLVKVRAALSRFAVDLKGDAITAENLLGQRLNAILATFDADVQAFVGSVGTVEERAQKLADAAVIVAGVESGFASSFNELAGILKDAQAEGEKLSDTYNRVVGAFTLFDDVLKDLGLSTDLTRTQFVAFAAGVVEALGGLDQAGQLLSDNLNAYLSQDERRQLALNSARRRLAEAGAAAGIAGEISPEAFKDLLNQALSGAFDPEKTAAILKYGAALALLNGLIKDAGEAIAVTVTSIEPNLSSLREASSGVREALADFGRTNFERNLAAARQQYAGTVEGLNALARAAGLPAAPLEDVGDALQLLTLQTAAAISQLQRDVLSSLIDLYGGDADTAAREFTSELDLLQNGFRVAQRASSDWAAQLERLERLDAATTLARNLRSLFENNGTGIAAGLAEFTVPLDRLLQDLGLSLNDLLSEQSVAAFVRAAGLLGLSVDEIAKLTGFDLSGLSQDQRGRINAAALAPKEDPVVGGLGKVERAATETTDEVEQLRMLTERKFNALIDAVRSVNTPTLLATVSPFAAAGVAP